MKRVGLFLAAAFCLVMISTSAWAATYYSQGSVTPNTLTNWNTNRLGGGTSPANFTTAGDIFVVQGTGNGGTSPHSMTTTAAWTVGAAGSKLQIESGATLQADHAITIGNATAIFQIDNGGTYIHNNLGAPSTTIYAGVESFGATSNFVMRLWGTTATSSTTGLTTGLTASILSGGNNYFYGNLTINTTAFTTLFSPGLTGTVRLCANDFAVNSTGTGTFKFATAAAGPTVWVLGSYSQSSGTSVDFNSNTSQTANTTLSLQGNFTLSGTAKLDNTGSGFAAINFVKSSGTQTVNVSSSAVQPWMLWTVGDGTTTNTVQLLSSLNVTGSTGIRVSTVTVNSNATLDLNGFTLRIEGSTTGNVAVAGTLSGTVASSKLLFSSSSTSTTTLSGAGTVNGSNLTVEYNHTGTGVNLISRDLTINTLTLIAGTLRLNATATQRIINLTNFSMAAGTLDTGSVDVTGNVTSVVNLTGNFNKTGGSVSNTSPSGLGVFVFKGAGAQGWSNTGTFQFATITVTNNSTLTLNTAMAFSGVSGPLLTIDLGSTVTAGTNQISTASASGNFVINGTLQTANSNGFSGSTLTTISSTNSPTITLGSSSTIEYNATGSQSITARTDYANLTISGNRGGNIVTLPAATVGLSGALTLSATNVLYAKTGNTIEFNGSGTQTIPVFDYNNLASSNTGARVLASSGVIGILGTFTPGGNSYTVTGSTMDFKSTVAQTVPAFTYNNLTISNTNPSGATGAAGVTVNALLDVQTRFTSDNSTYQNVQIDSGATMATTSSASISVKGNWSNNGGTFTPSTSTVTFNGTSQQQYTNTGTGSFYNLTVNNSAGLLLNNDLTVSNVLSLSSGIVNASTNSRTVIVTNTSNTAVTRTSGYIDGKLQWSLPSPIVSSTIYVFPLGTTNGYSPFTLDITSNVNATSFTASAANVYMTGITDTTKAIQRTWTLTPAPSNPTLTANLTFQYLDADLGTAVEATLDAFRRNADNSINQIPASSRNAGANTVTVNGINAFSDWTLANGGAAPTAVNMRGFSAIQSPGGSVLVQWQTGREVSNLGFVVYREVGGRRTRITPSMVAGSALLAGARTTLTAGQSYTWFDQLPKIRGFVQYWVEDVDLNGTRTLHGPIIPRVSVEGRFSRDNRSVLLSEIQASRSTATSAPAAEQGRPATLRADVERADELVVPGAVVSDVGGSGEERDPTDQQREIAAGQAVKLFVRQDGWYRVTRGELLAAGLNASARPEMLRLFVDGVEQPIIVRSSDSETLSEDATLEFYGTGLNQQGSDAHTYWLIAGSQPGKRIAAVERSSGGGLPPRRGGTNSRSYAYTVERRDRVLYFASLHNGDEDNFFGPIISTTAATQTLNVKQLDTASVGTATLEVALQGGTLQGHQVRVKLNGQDVGTMSFNNQEHPVTSFNVSPAMLVEGQNTITLTSLGGDTDVSVVDYVNLTYARKYVADNDALAFTATGGGNTTVSGFTGPHITVYNISDPAKIQAVSATVSQQGASYAITINGGDIGRQGRSFLAVAEGGMQQVASASANQPSSLTGDQAGADFVIITHRDFKAAVEPLAQLRRSQGLSVSVVDVEDIYDEFSFGIHSTEAVKDFLAWTRSNWATAPRYALLVGDASLDPRNYLGYGNQDFVPTRIVDSAYLETASDDALADFDNDGLADIAVGRLPARTVQQAQLMVGKIVNYVPGQNAQGALLVADRNDGYDFEGASSNIRNLLPGNMPVTIINRGNNSDQQVKSQIISGINQGPMIVNYVGHGSVEVWTGSGILSSTDASTLSNGNHLPLVVTMTCLNGYFQDVYTESLAEALMRSEGGGSIAVWSSSGLTEPGPQANMNRQLIQLLFSDGQSPMLGDAVRSAKEATTDTDVRRTWILFGDPTMRIR